MSRNLKRTAGALASFDCMRATHKSVIRLDVSEGLTGYDAAMKFDRTDVLFRHRIVLRSTVPGEFNAGVDSSVTLFATDPDRPGELIEGRDPRRLQRLQAAIQAGGCIPAVMAQELETGVRFRSMVGIVPMATADRGQA